jgi:hypothetical protein
LVAYRQNIAYADAARIELFSVAGDQRPPEPTKFDELVCGSKLYVIAGDSLG